MRNSLWSVLFVAVGLQIIAAGAGTSSLDRADARRVFQPEVAVNVTQHHNNLSRDGLYVDPAFTQSNAANLARDTNFDGTIAGNVYAQPLYIVGAR